MIERILPLSIDNRFAGYRAAVWLFAFVVLVRMLMSLNMIFNARGVALGPDGIPLEIFGESAGSRFLTLFVVLGLSQLSFALLASLALLRYRSMIPLLYLVFLGEMLVRRLLLYAQPLARDGPAPSGFYVNVVLLGITVAGLLLSLRHRPPQDDQNAPGGTLAE